MSFVITEGSYTAYSLYDTLDADPYGFRAKYFLVNCLETKALIMIDGEWVLYDIATKTYGSALGTQVIPSPYTDLVYSTFLGTYMCMIDRSGTPYYLVIYKNGAELQRISFADLDLVDEDPTCVQISARGKYILISATSISTGLNIAVILQGS